MSVVFDYGSAFLSDFNLGIFILFFFVLTCVFIGEHSIKDIQCYWIKICFIVLHRINFYFVAKTIKETWSLAQVVYLS